jgi:hypothetical protein
MVKKSSRYCPACCMYAPEFPEMASNTEAIAYTINMPRLNIICSRVWPAVLSTFSMDFMISMPMAGHTAFCSRLSRSRVAAT